jgi:phage-related protein
VEHSRSAILSFQKVENETQNLSQLVTDTVQLMEEHLRTQSQELQYVQEETQIAIQSQIDIVKQHLQDLQTLSLSVAEQNKAGHLKLEDDLRQYFRTLYACNMAYLNILLKKEEDQKNGMKALGQKLSFQSAMTSIIQIVGGGLASGFGAVIVSSSRNAAERNNPFPDSHQRGMVHDPSYAAPLRYSPVFSKPVKADNCPMATPKTSERVSCIVDECSTTFSRQADMERHLIEHHGPVKRCHFPKCPWEGARRNSRVQEHTKKAHPELYDGLHSRSALADALISPSRLKKSK